MSTPTHKQVKLFNPIENTYYNVDIKLRGLLSLLWSKNVNTTMSCQSITPYFSSIPLVWIEFEYTKDLHKIRTIIEKDLNNIILTTIISNDGVSLWFEPRHKQQVYKLLRKKL